MNYLHLEKLAAHLASTGILCLRFTCRTRNFQYRKECFTAVVVSCNEIRSMFLPFVFWLSRRLLDSDRSDRSLLRRGAGMGEKMGGLEILATANHMQATGGPHKWS